MSQPPPPPADPSAAAPGASTAPTTRAPAAEGATIPRTRTSSAWWALGSSLVLLIVVLVFILQNLASSRTSFLFVRWTVPLGLDLLLAAVFGSLITFLLGGARMLQLRRVARRQGRRPGPGGGSTPA